MSQERIRVVIAGPRGRMGQEAVAAVLGADDMQLVACVDRVPGVVNLASAGLVPVYTDAVECLSAVTADVWVDFTRSEPAVRQVGLAVNAGVRPVIGTTGISAEVLAELDHSLRDQQLCGLYAPNFAIGALLMIRAAELAVRYLPHAEIVEYHHENKLDAPSGTARKTAEVMARVIDQERLSQSGEEVAAIPIHSVRLPGFVAHQEVILGGQGERLTIRHDSMSRSSFMPGVLLGIRGVMGNATGLIDGLEHFLW